MVKQMNFPKRSSAIQWEFLIAYFGGGYVAWAIGMFISRRAFKRDWDEASIAGMTAGFANTVMLGVPLIVHEQNRVPGMTNRFLARMASEVFQAFEGTFPDASGALTCGNPVRPELAEFEPPATRFKDRFDHPPSLLVTGGSQGASSINRDFAGSFRITSTISSVVCFRAGSPQVGQWTVPSRA